MRAAVFDRFGPPDVLRIADLPDPEPGPGQVRVRVRAAGVQPFDVKVRGGGMPWVKAAQTASGALAELAVGADDVLLVHAAAGSVGTVAVQLAGLAGATVIGTASPANHGYLRQLGAQPVAYGTGLVQAVRELPRPTVALDAVGGTAIAQSVELGIAPDRIGTIVDDKTAAEYGTRVVRAGRSPQRLAEVIALAARGVITMPVRAYPLTRVAEAHAAVESGHGRGKVVLIVEP